MAAMKRTITSVLLSTSLFLVAYGERYPTNSDSFNPRDIVNVPADQPIGYAQYEITHFETIDFSYKEKTEKGTWTGWSDWEDSNLIVCWVHNDSTDTFIISSERTQIYEIIDYCEKVTDSAGGTQLILKAKDQDNLICKIRYRVDDYSLVGITQIYIVYDNIKFVYNLRKIID